MEHQALSEREQDILFLTALGIGNKHIARRMNVSVRTIEGHRTELRRKLGVGTVGRLDAMIAVALRQDSRRVAALLGIDAQAVEFYRLNVRQALS
jgi:DNA-binding CsgD family transcriptional regulator